MPEKYGDAERKLDLMKLREEYRQRLQTLPDPRSALYKPALAALKEWTARERLLIQERYINGRAPRAGRPTTEDPGEAWQRQQRESVERERDLMRLIGEKLYRDTIDD